jgi:hypothetical protein
MRTKLTESGFLCYALGHRWETADFRVTHGRVVCDRCGEDEWRAH